jgi:hypothetical protein
MKLKTCCFLKIVAIALLAHSSLA